MAIATLIVGMIAVAAMFTYFLVMVALALLGMVLLIGLYLVALMYSYGGGLAAGLTGIVYLIVVFLAYTYHVEEQRRAEEERQRQEAERQAAAQAETVRLREEALKKPWHDRSIKEWGRVLF